MLVLTGLSEAEAKQAANKIITLETALAESSRSQVQLREAGQNYHKLSRAAAHDLMPYFDWDQYFAALGSQPDVVIVGQPEFFRALEQQLTTAPVADLALYLKWHLLRQAAPYLQTALAQESFAFTEGVLYGTTKMPPRWKRVLLATNAALGQAVGKLYVAATFPPDAKTSTQELVKNIKNAFAARIQHLDWMGSDTKQQALAKLRAMTVKIGYPDSWRDYQALQVGTASFAENVFLANRFKLTQELAQIGQPLDPGEWRENPQEVTPFYSETSNELVFPAGILQPPFYTYGADAAVNYGGIGAVIGHELSHGFDDEGSRYDARGNLREWWSPQDRQRFEARSRRLVEQFNRLRVLDSLPVNGTLTLSENIADLGGLAVAYDAWQLHERQHGSPGPIAGYTPTQRFFMGWAQLWRTKYQDEMLRSQLLINPQSPSEFRVNGPVSNLPAWYRAFGVTGAHRLYREANQRVAIW